MRRPRRTFSPEFRAKVAIAALKGDKTLADLAEQFALHSNQIIQFRQYALEHMAELFDKDKAPKAMGDSGEDLNSRFKVCCRNVPTSIADSTDYTQDQSATIAFQKARRKIQ